MTTTVGQVLLKFFLPPQFHHLVEGVRLDKKGIAKLFAELVEKASPEQYSKIASDLTRLGFEVSTRQGTSLTLKDLVSPIDTRKMWDDFDKFKGQVEASKEPQSAKDEKIFGRYNEMMGKIEKDILDIGLKENKSLAKIILAGARGTAAQYRGTIATQGLVTDAEGKPRMDIPIKSSYAEGLSLPEYLVTSFGARSGEVKKKISVAQGGYGCLTAACKVRMADLTTKSIADVVVGDQVLGADMSGKTFPVTVTATFDNGIKEAYAYRFRKGKQRSGYVTIYATDKHKVLSKLASKDPYSMHRLEAAKKHFSICPTTGTTHQPTLELYPLLAGLFIGDGCMTDATHLGFTSADTVMVAELNNLLHAEGLQLKKARRREQDYEYYLTELVRSPREREANGRILPGKCYNKASIYLDSLGLRGKLSYEKTLPKGLSLNAMANLLAGLFEADGMVSSSNNSTVPIIGFKSTSRRLIEGVADTLSCLFGVHAGKIQTHKADKIKPSTFKLRGKEITVTARRDSYSFIINDRDSVLRFASAIQMPGRKGKTLAAALTRIDYTGRYDQFAYHYTGEAIALGPCKVYDIEVDHPDHLYVLDSGLIVSNSKQFARALMPLQVVEHDCGTSNGVSFPVSDRESLGAFLAKPAGSYNRNNEVTVKMLADLKAANIEHIVVRSPMTCQSNKEHHSGGLCQMCVGKREKGMPEMDTYVGLVAGTAVAEPLTESAMKARHSGGAASSLGTGITGFKLINQLANIPKTFLGKAPLAQEDGIVTELHEAAAGGHFMKVNGEEHYIGLDQTPKFKLGDRVEQGQALSTGLVDPRDAVRLRGIGDGRKYYMEAMRKAFDESGLGVNRRNFELIAKAAIDHVKITDPEGIGNYSPDQIVSYSALEKDYVPRSSAKDVRTDYAYGKYLEKPELHYTIGTKVTTAVLKELKNNHIESVLVHDDPPNFEPNMVRLLDVPEFHDDWMHVLNSTNLAKRFVGMVNKGATSDTRGASPIPGIAYGVDFGVKNPVG